MAICASTTSLRMPLTSPYKKIEIIYIYCFFIYILFLAETSIMADTINAFEPAKNCENPECKGWFVNDLTLKKHDRTNAHLVCPYAHVTKEQKEQKILPLVCAYGFLCNNPDCNRAHYGSVEYLQVCATYVTHGICDNTACLFSHEDFIIATPVKKKRRKKREKREETDQEFQNAIEAAQAEEAMEQKETTEKAMPKRFVKVEPRVTTPDIPEIPDEITVSPDNVGSLFPGTSWEEFCGVLKEIRTKEKSKPQKSTVRHKPKPKKEQSGAAFNQPKTSQELQGQWKASIDPQKRNKEWQKNHEKLQQAREEEERRKEEEKRREQEEERKRKAALKTNDAQLGKLLFNKGDESDTCSEGEWKINNDKLWGE
jgi:hypothetical protein